MMKINEVSERTRITKRAIKYYEQKGLLNIRKDENGYRNYEEADIKVLQKISLYRKLGVPIPNIRQMLQQEEEELYVLRSIYEQQCKESLKNEERLQQLKKIIDHSCDENLLQEMEDHLPYESIANALKEMIPGGTGEYFMYHFLPYLQLTITTKEQQEAYDTIIKFWDNFDMKIPFVMKMTSYLQKKCFPNDMQVMTSKIDENIQKLLHPTSEEYEQTKMMIARNVKMKNSFLYKYNPIFITQRHFMKALQNCGYNDIFIPNMKILSPKYKAYQDALTQMNDRVCHDLGLYYDADYHLIMKK